MRMIEIDVQAVFSVSTSKSRYLLSHVSSSPILIGSPALDFYSCYNRYRNTPYLISVSLHIAPIRIVFGFNIENNKMLIKTWNVQWHTRVAETINKCRVGIFLNLDACCITRQ